VAALPLARKLDVPLLVTFHGYDASRLLRNRTYVAALKELFTYARGLTVCDAIRRRLVDKGVAESRLRTHYIGVSLTSFPYKQRPTLSQKVRSGQPARFLQVGRFVEKKGHVYTIQAFHGLLQDGYDCYLELVGDGPLLKACRGLVRDLRIDQRVHFWGAQPPTMVAQLMADADAFVHHSVTARDGDQEGIPLSIMEAMATGLPVAATSHSGIAELVVDGETGRLVPERDVPAYVQALRDLIVADCDMGAESRRVVESRFDLNQQNVELTSIYRSLAE
jgi:glycosyltransferase involved in cell wall biosynthesis